MLDGTPFGPGGPLGPRGPCGPGGPLIPVPPIASSPGGPCKHSRMYPFVFNKYISNFHILV